jgi:hypothetical protein
MAKNDSKPAPKSSDSDEVKALHDELEKLGESEAKVDETRRRIRRLQREVGMDTEVTGQYPVYRPSEHADSGH